jgi:hypothetical protein
MIFINKRSFCLKTCFMFFLCCSFTFTVETYNVELSSMFGIKYFEVYKGILVYIPMDLKIQCLHYFNIILGLHFHFQ